MTATTFHTTAATTFPVSMLTRIATLVDRFAEGIHEGRRIHARYQELSRLSRAERARFGLDRQSIARAALNGR